MNRDSDGTQLDFENAGSADPISTVSPPPSTDTALQSTNETPPAIPKKDVSNGLGKKRKRSSKDEGRDDKKSRFQKPLTSRFPKVGVSAKADNENSPLESDSVATEAVPGRDAHEGPHDVSTSTEPPVQPFLLPLTAKEESPWETYNKELVIELGGLVTMAERKHPAYGLVIVKQFSGHNAESKLSRLRQIPENIQSKYFVSCVEIFNFQNISHIITEYMAISLLQIVAAPRYPRENQVAAIIGQVC